MRLIHAGRKLITGIQEAPFGAASPSSVINWALAPRGLQYGFIFNGGVTNAEICGNPVLNYVETHGLGFGYPRTIPSRGGLALDNGSYGSNGSAVGCTIPIQAPPQCSMEALIDYQTLISVYGSEESYGRVTDGTPDSGAFDRILGIDTSNKAFFYIYDGSNPQTVTGTANSTTGIPLHIVGVAHPSNIKIYVNGILQGTTSPTASGGYTGFSTPTFWVGWGKNAPGANVKPINFIIYCLFANKAWSDAEVMQRYLDPYSFINTPEGNWPSLLGSGFTAVFRKTFSSIGTRVGSRQGRIS